MNHSQLYVKEAKELSFEDKLLAARDKDTPPKILKKLAENNIVISYNVATNPNTPIETLSDFANNKNDWILRLNVARNSKLPRQLLEKLAADENKIVRKAVFNNCNTDDEIRKIIRNTDKLYEYLK